MIVYHIVALVFAVMIDKLIGDPRTIPHPVVGIGRLISFLESRLNQGSKRKQKGIVFVFLVIIIVFSIVTTICIFAYKLHPILGVIFEAVLISYTIAAKGLAEAAEEVKLPLDKGDLESARMKLSYIVGRDTQELSEAEIVRGAVETVAENTSDGITAPLFYALIGGAPLAFLYRAVNTCDSMVGYKNQRFLQFGWASARLDDLLNLVPSRITGMIMLLVNKSNYSKKECLQIVLNDAKKHPSPNSGWGEAAVAAILGIQLGGENTYQGMKSFRATMGKRKQPIKPRHITDTIQIMWKTVIVFLILLCFLGVIIFVIT